MDGFDLVYSKDDGFSIYSYNSDVEFYIDEAAKRLNRGDKIPLVDGRGCIIVRKESILLFDQVMRGDVVCTYKIPVPKRSFVIIDPYKIVDIETKHPKIDKVKKKRLDITILEDQRFIDLWGDEYKTKVLPEIFFLRI